MDNKGTQVQLPQYECHKTVRAAKITGVELPELDWDSEEIASGEAKLLFGEIQGYVILPLSWYARHMPEVGGYYVVYEDGYQSYSPAQAFEVGYTKV